MKRDKTRIYYDKKSDVLWLVLKRGLEEEYREVAPGVNVEIGRNGELLGIEILNASKILAEKIGRRENQRLSTASA